MIVGAGSVLDSGTVGTPRATLDDLFRRAAVRNPDVIAVADPQDRPRFTSGEARALSYADADRVVWAIAARLRALGLQTDSVVGVQLPNTVESVLTLLGIVRAGMIAAPLPMLWRETEMIAALSGVGAKALITTSRIGEADHGEVAARVAAGLFSIRHVCAYGDNLADGIVPLDDVFAARPAMLPIERDGDPAAHAAIVTFEPTPRGMAPVARNHMQLVAGGMAVVAAGKLPQDAVLLSATPAATFAGLSLTLTPWLLSGGRLLLHHPFDPHAFREAADAPDCSAVILPGPLAAAFADLPVNTALIALWRAPERRDDAPSRRNVIDVTAFGEFGFHAIARGDDGRIAPLALGPVGAFGTDPATAIETRRSAKGTLLLRGPMVANSGLEAAEPPIVPDDFIDTGYPCRIDAELGSLVVTGPQPGMIGIGGYRVARNEIDAFTAALPADSPIAALPDALLGQRLRGRAADPAAVMRAARGANPLIAGAFGSAA